MEDKTQERDQFVEDLYDKMNFRLKWIAARKLIDPDQVEEAVQEALAILCLKAEEVMVHPNPEGWLTETVKNIAKAMNRKTAKERNVVSGSLNDAHGHYHDDHHEAEFKDLLSPEDYKLIELVVVQRYTIAEAARELGITTEACKKRKQRAIQRLRQKLFGDHDKKK